MWKPMTSGVSKGSAETRRSWSRRQEAQPRLRQTIGEHMGPEEFRKLALSLPNCEERQHMDHPDFRVGGRVFATLGYPDEKWAMVKLTPEQQAEFICREPAIF